MPVRDGYIGAVAISFIAAFLCVCVCVCVQLLIDSPVSSCPHELSNHPEAQNKPGAVPPRKRKDEVVFTK